MGVTEREEVAMTVVLSVVCERCGSEHRPDRPVRSFSAGAVRTRAALHGWTQLEQRGVVLDVCPACMASSVPDKQRAAAEAIDRFLVRAASAASLSGSVEVVVCHWCEEDQHQWCTGCECAAHR